MSVICISPISFILSLSLKLCQFLYVCLSVPSLFRKWSCFRNWFGNFVSEYLTLIANDLFTMHYLLCIIHIHCIRRFSTNKIVS